MNEKKIRNVVLGLSIEPNNPVNQLAESYKTLFGINKTDVLNAFVKVGMKHLDEVQKELTKELNK